MVYYSLIKYVSLMFELVARRIRLLDQLPCGATRKHRERELDVVIQQHYLALRCAELLEELISPILLAQFLGCVLVWCLLILYITMSYGISDEIYSFRWYDAPISVQKKAMLISARSQKIVGVTAFKFYFVSIEQFGKVMFRNVTSTICVECTSINDH
ncbi:uncharacterized protein LOC131681961 isoform X3 [Topomyia yanbarensis]|uniref:uncharacterized protein LOC131681961 isoform X3 n=1 Tax=Topomyia yanbarensis TaxID=2498891 RepID=UPI00273CD484|nr:uncharacterized protein LOC131681961 isoform X3 [Topomyia yanbarensis]